MDNVFIYCAFLIGVYMTLLFVCALINKRNDIADIGWGLGFCIVALLSLNFDFYVRGGLDWRSVLVVALVLIWGLRLAIHIFLRNSKKSEDPRYAKWRIEWGKWFYVRSYLQVFLLQGFLLLLISIPVIFSATYHNPIFPTVLDVIGLTIWIIGFMFEVVGDKQLANFLKNPSNKGQIMNKGLWSLTRHPNYFGEVTMWWGIWLISVAASAPWWSIIGPLTITILITKVSGIPMTEKRYQGNALYDEYKKNVSALIPLHYGKKLFGNYKQYYKNDNKI